MKNLIKLFLYPFFYLVFLLSYLIPRNKNIWLFGSFGGGFNDNAKYLFIYLSENYPEVKAIWISDNKARVNDLTTKGLESYYKWSLKGFFYCLLGKYYFFNAYLSDINLWTSGGAVKINLWHGVPIKKIEFDIRKGEISHIFNNSLVSKYLYLKHYLRPDYILSTSRKVSRLFSSAFRVDTDCCLEFGYPRNEFLLSSKNDILNFIQRYESDETLELINSMSDYNKIYVYMPTWRDDGYNFILESKIDFERLCSVLKEKNNLLIIKLHNNTSLPASLERFSNILLLNNKVDVYPILPFTDCLITDYSSVYFDYKLIKNEVVFFAFDKERYLHKDREMYFDYNEIIKSELAVENFEELLNVICINKVSTVGKGDQFLKDMIYETSHVETNKKIVEFISNLSNCL